MSWDFVKIGDVCKTGAGGTPLKSRKEYYDSGTIPWLLSGEVAQGEIHKSEKFISRAGLENSSAKIFPVNTVLVAMYGATAGQVGILRCEAATNQAVCGIHPNSDFVPEFMFYAMLSKQAELISTATGNAQPNISQIKVKNTVIPIPPLPEQKRIVAILDEAFAGIDAAVANTEKNLANARELFESYLNAVFTRKGEGWVDTPVSGVATVTSGHSFKSGDFSEKNDVKSIKITNVGVREFVSETSNFLPRDFANTYKKFLVEEGSIVIALTRSIISAGLKVAVVPSEYEGSLLNQRVAALRVDSGTILRQFLYSYLCTQSVVDFVKKQANTLMQPNLSITDLKNLLVPVPPMAEQQQIVDKIDALSTETQHLETIYQQKLAALAELKQSILQKAFAGELTTLPEKTIEEAVA